MQKVLVIDDCPSIHALLKARLVDEPIELVFADNGESGLRLARETSPDLILLDVDMPHPDGFDVCRQLKAAPATDSIPVIFLSGVDDTQQKIKGLDLGAVDYITKPFEPAELRARVRASLRTKFLLDLLAKRAMIDGLTGLWNRAYFDQSLRAQLSLTRRSRQPLACILLDVDHFKGINDQWGHPFGDEVIRSVGQVLTDCCRTEDIVCRYGGEEFAILAPNTDRAGAAGLAERLRAKVAQRHFCHRGTCVRVTASLGVADANLPDREMIVEEADRALYRAKQSGRDCVRIAEPALRAVG